ncbi:hypothetical protein AZL_001800 [Azospirillum sp. B510]|uniref:hypothetical protein n=1 Tax=Azospirillum sp. (strain B510) TaxID=137722 RepID=UPI0001C4C196|nr:hypothetical protein [Azospirillum sp. B510]BAI70818.1 hypothetical protein AZL_001800 [Azospirillum sp. B510]
MLSPAAPPLSAERRSRTVPPRAEPYGVDGEPFAGAEEAWYWAVQAHDAKAAGARVVAGCGQIARPCEPQDLLRVVDRLYRMRKLQRDHLHVLVHYGRRRSAPEPERFREQRAHVLWEEAFAAIAPALRDKGITR